MPRAPIPAPYGGNEGASAMRGCLGGTDSGIPMSRLNTSMALIFRPEFIPSGRYPPSLQKKYHLHHTSDICRAVHRNNAPRKEKNFFSQKQLRFLLPTHDAHPLPLPYYAPLQTPGGAHSQSHTQLALSTLASAC